MLCNTVVTEDISPMQISSETPKHTHRHRPYPLVMMLLQMAWHAPEPHTFHASFMSLTLTCAIAPGLEEINGVETSLRVLFTVWLLIVQHFVKPFDGDLTSSFKHIIRPHYSGVFPQALRCWLDYCFHSRQFFWSSESNHRQFWGSMVFSTHCWLHLKFWMLYIHDKMTPTGVMLSLLYQLVLCVQYS